MNFDEHFLELLRWRQVADGLRGIGFYTHLLFALVGANQILLWGSSNSTATSISA
jgi:hypothetical protein